MSLRAIKMLERLRDDAVMSKFATQRDCQVYRQAVEDMLTMLRAVPLDAAPQEGEPGLPHAPQSQAQQQSGLHTPAAAAPCSHPWRGEGPEPVKWECCGMVIYRSYADYCWD
jgi:hypothetical protein